MSEAAKQFQHELARLVIRYSEESDLSVGELIAALELEKLNLFIGINRQIEEGDE